MDDKPFRELLGSLMWGSTCTRADIAFATGYLARFQLNPGRAHWDALLWLAGYVLWTVDYCIVYRKPEAGEVSRGRGLQPAGFSDSDFANCLDTRRSTSGYVFFMAGAPVSWSSKRQGSVAMSTVGAEYVALARASEQATWLSSFLVEVDLAQDGPVMISADNTGSVSLTENSKKLGLVKHIDTKHHHIREKVDEGRIAINLIRTGENVADILTKALNGPMVLKFVKMLGYRTE